MSFFVQLNINPTTHTTKSHSSSASRHQRRTTIHKKATIKSNNKSYRAICSHVLLAVGVAKCTASDPEEAATVGFVTFPVFGADHCLFDSAIARTANSKLIENH